LLTYVSRFDQAQDPVKVNTWLAAFFSFKFVPSKYTTTPLAGAAGAVVVATPSVLALIGFAGMFLHSPY
jgi:hypothetical protein